MFLAYHVDVIGKTWHEGHPLYIHEVAERVDRAVEVEQHRMCTYNVVGKTRGFTKGVVLLELIMSSNLQKP